MSVRGYNRRRRLLKKWKFISILRGGLLAAARHPTSPAGPTQPPPPPRRRRRRRRRHRPPPPLLRARPTRDSLSPRQPVAARARRAWTASSSATMPTRPGSEPTLLPGPPSQ